MYIMTNDLKLIDLETGNQILVEGREVILRTTTEDFTLGTYEKPEDELKNLASKLTTYVMPQGVEK